MNHQSNPTVIVSNITNHLQNRYMRLWSYFIIDKEGEGYYFVKGERIPAKTFESLYPIELINIID